MVRIIHQRNFVSLKFDSIIKKIKQFNIFYDYLQKKVCIIIEIYQYCFQYWNFTLKFRKKYEFKFKQKDFKYL